MPHGKHSHLVIAGNVVDVIARLLQQNAPVPRTGDCRYRRPICGATPITSNEAVSSWKKRSGAAFRLLRHQSSIAPIWTSASGVVRTGRLTAAGAVRRESPMPDEAGPLPPTPRTRREPRAERGARRPSESSLSSSATESMVVPSGRVVGSSRTSRPFSTRARRGPIRLLYGFH